MLENLTGLPSITNILLTANRREKQLPFQAPAASLPVLSLSKGRTIENFLTGTGSTGFFTRLENVEAASLPLAKGKMPLPLCFFLTATSLRQGYGGQESRDPHKRVKNERENKNLRQPQFAGKSPASVSLYALFNIWQIGRMFSAKLSRPLATIYINKKQQDEFISHADPHTKISLHRFG